MPTRALACAIDVLVQGMALGLILSLVFGFLIGTDSSESLAAALIILTVLLVVVGYRLVMETLTRGRTLGKYILGLKVVRDDGSSIRFRHALVRTLMWFFVDFAPWFAASPGIVASLMNKEGKRIGDMVAGTVVIRERHQPMASPPLFVPSQLVQWAQSLELSQLPDDLANTARDYLARFVELDVAARAALGETLAFRFSELTAPAPPQPMIAPAFLSAVLAERRRRELIRLATARPAATGPFAAPTNPYAVPAGPFAPPSPYGAVPAAPAPTPFLPPPPPAAPARPATHNTQGWATPGSDSGWS
ncbi:RDD family protein [Kribbella sandramycini]|uniref:RDD family protein n=2 Tax=Kribbella sandramycini TaxID=60450 RepID=A0A7Y4L5Q3_9ACTN|nr:RDD family protein [Kribbella sandramycini]NOL44880.1 RDD family protein [Kribbella sandramycini]